MLSQKIQSLPESGTIAVSSKVKEMIQQGVDIINFSAGDPDFDTPQSIKESIVNALKNNETHYTHVAGTSDVRKAICKKLLKENNINYKPAEVMTSNGGKQILFMLFQTILNPNDEVIIPSPFWTSYNAQVEYTGAHAKEVSTRENNFIFTADLFEKNITNHTKAVIINSPSNPTGAVIPKEELQKIGDLAVKHNIIIISDEAYEYFSYGTPVISIASLSKNIQKQTFTVNTASKSFAMTGLRIGYIAGDKSIIEALCKLQSQLSSNPCSTSQAALIEGLQLGKTCAQEMLETFQKRANYLEKMLENDPLFTMESIGGAFYAWINIEKCYNEDISNSQEFCSYVLEHAHVALVPGSAFGEYGEGYIRLSFVQNISNLQKGISKIINLFT